MKDKDLLVVNKVNKIYKDFSLKDISFTLPEGYILGLIDKNGAGKTTLMKCIIGAIEYEGKVSVDGAVNTVHKRAATEKIGFIIEDGPFLGKESLLKNGELLGVLYDDWDEEKFDAYLKKFGLYYDTNYEELSKGMETKFQLAFALAHSPRLLILDEPTGGLDPVFRREFLKLLQNVVNEEMLSVIISTHLTADLDKIADYVMMLDEGKMVFYEDKETLADKYPLVSGTDFRCRRGYCEYYYVTYYDGTGDGGAGGVGREIVLFPVNKDTIRKAQYLMAFKITGIQLLLTMIPIVVTFFSLI